MVLNPKDGSSKPSARKIYTLLIMYPPVFCILTPNIIAFFFHFYNKKGILMINRRVKKLWFSPQQAVRCAKITC